MLDEILVVYKMVIFTFLEILLYFGIYLNLDFYMPYRMYFNTVKCISCIEQWRFCYAPEKHNFFHEYNNLNYNVYKDSVYVVKAGDTLFYIAWITGNNYLDLSKKNNISDINMLKVGQVIKVKQNIIIWSLYCIRNKIKEKYILLRKTYIKLYKINFFNNITSCFNKSDKIIFTYYWARPTLGKIINTFSDCEGGNKGIDISGLFNQPIFAAYSGKVIYVGDVLKGYGNLIIIKHDNDYLSAYAHNNKILVTERQQVKTGEQIATMGNSGTNEVKLHFEIRHKGKSVNPLFLISFTY
ncbi:lipoprotein [Candidatus Blochmanniella vafra str. BVAF]|uniref:Murein hydrolase activator NlpD n=1 Tax=Blochmanniella vafra (strain BVAF) TaxID=859654 RepID=E8Q5S9_BLOVB|nr:peptidoglycan DD-metalloendopeptidase family protein [Candidatus Blochmannia vafer]ADV33576.1 lipoprotein [Candidatus Blochmannia vafer str. BVAF]